jgi:phosphatidate phosphatase APP1
MEYMPDRDFILVGDSGEKDPKIYLKMCRLFGDRVKGVFIREIAERPLETDVFRKLQESTGSGYCKKFSTAEELANLSSEIFTQ